MKKIMMTLAAAMVAVTMNAQYYVGGTIGIGSLKVGDADNETAWKFKPEVGYNVNSDWAVGVAFGWTKGNLGLLKGDISVDDTRTFEVNPYVRYTFLKSKLVNVFSDLSVSYGHAKGGLDAYGVGITPGVAVNLSDNLSFVSKVAFVGWQHAKYNGLKADAFGVDIDGNNVQFGLYYNF